MQDVATKTGLSNGMISQLERARHAVDTDPAPAQHRARRSHLLLLRDQRSRRCAALHRAQEQPAPAAAHRQRRRQGSADAGRQGPARTL
ncbi:hypothetical protein [Bradyrhizobium japonicum]|uniref:hypothetical protein n=1 Tax=Bradyrhizobium japonicum TaxID=375 RepID=UPI002168DB93|nr:hypothetical protein [Bradyrhizobium japonicum]